MNSKVINVVLPDDVLEALEAEASKMGVSADAVATSILCDEVCVTLAKKASAA